MTGAVHAAMHPSVALSNVIACHTGMFGAKKQLRELTQLDKFFRICILNYGFVD